MFSTLLRVSAAGALVLVVGCTPAGAPDRPDTGSYQPTPGRPAVDPQSVRVPAHGIAAEPDPLRLDQAGVLVPPAYGRAGWYAAGPEPGDRGPAVIAGHVDSDSGPDVFARLPQLVPGDRIAVGLEDGRTLGFTVTRVRQFAQSRFPTRQVYGPTARPELRLITCGGDYDRDAGRYLDNVVVFATLDP